MRLEQGGAHDHQWISRRACPRTIHRCGGDISWAYQVVHFHIITLSLCGARTVGRHPQQTSG
jgi:hypothetical protein